MPSIRGWNGAAWVSPEWYTGSKGWKPYSPPVQQMVYHFNGGDNGGWTYNNYGTSWPPANTDGDELVIGRYPDRAYTFTHFSPQIDDAVLDGPYPSGYMAQCSVRGEVYSNPGGQPLELMLQVGHSSASYEWVWHTFTGSFGNIIMTTPTLGRRSQTFNVTMNADMVNYTSDAGQWPSYTLFVDWCQILDQNGAILTNPGMQPYFYNGSSWVAQTS